MRDRSSESAPVEDSLPEARAATQTPLDAVVVGAGICGVIFLKYARDEGLRCLALEKQADVGGLWVWQPAWQDLQNRRQDFAVDGVPLEGVRQPDVHEHVREWVRRYDLARSIVLRCAVTSVEWTDGCWRVVTTRGAVRARHLVVASGVQNEPWTPDIKRSGSEVAEVHACRLDHPEDLAGQRVTVVGGGASGMDLLDIAIANGERELHWVYRGIRWFLPTLQRKQSMWPNLRELAMSQSFLRSPRLVNGFIRWILELKFNWHKLKEIQPDEPFDFAKHQLIPGRRRMIRRFDSIARHQSEVRSIEGREVVLANGDRFETDVLLWGTGYRMNLRYLGLPEYRSVNTLEKLRPKLGSLVRATDYPNLFFLGMSLIDSTSATPFFAAIEAKSIVAHVLHKCEIPAQNIPHILAYWEVLNLFASFDRANYPRRLWRIRSVLLAVWYQLLRNASVKI